jgi:hypothetical protein
LAENLRAATELLGQPQRCVHVGDQDSDIFDLFGTARQLGTQFLVRTRGYRRLRIQTAKGKKKRYPEQTVTEIEAREQEMPPDQDRIGWKLITDLTVRTRREAVEKCNGMRCAGRSQSFTRSSNQAAGLNSRG